MEAKLLRATAFTVQTHNISRSSRLTTLASNHRCSKHCSFRFPNSKGLKNGIRSVQAVATSPGMGKKSRVDETESYTLDGIRSSLIRQEDSIIFGLVERAQYCYNPDTYNPDAFPMEAFHGSLIEYILKETEKLHAKVGRYNSPDEHPFFPNEVPQPMLPPLQYPQVLHPVASSININIKVWDMYCSCTPRGLMGLDTVIGSDLLSVEGQAECLSNSGGGGGDAKHGLELGGLLQESLVLETSSSFGSTNSSISMSNLPAIGVHGDETGFNLLEKRLRVPSSASLESDISVGSVGFQSKPSTYQEPFIQVVSGATSCTTEPESPISNASNLFQTQKMVQVPAYQVSQQSDGKAQHHGVQYVQGGPYYIPQFTTTPLPLSSCYPVYQVPVQQSPYTLSQQYPIYFVPVHPTPSINDTATISPNRPILHPQGHVIPPPTAQKDFPSAQQVPDSSAKVYRTIPISTVPVSAPSTQGQQQFVGHLEAQFSSQPVSSTSVSVTNYSDEFDDDLSYAQIYKSQPPAPAFISQCQTITKGQQYSYKSPQCSNT